MNTDHADARAQSNLRYPEIGGCWSPVCGHTLAEHSLDVSCRRLWQRYREEPAGSSADRQARREPC